MNQESLPTICFSCGCGQKLYTVSTNVLAYSVDLECPSCGQRYECRDTLIARAVPAKPAEIQPSRIQLRSESGTEA